MQVRREDFHADPSHKHFSAFASDLGFGVGQWPEIVRMGFDNFDNRAPIKSWLPGDEEFHGYLYIGPDGMTIKIFND